MHATLTATIKGNSDGWLTVTIGDSSHNNSYTTTAAATTSTIVHCMPHGQGLVGQAQGQAVKAGQGRAISGGVAEKTDKIINYGGFVKDVFFMFE